MDYGKQEEILEGEVIDSDYAPRGNGLSIEHEKILKQLEAARSSEERVKVFSVIADDFGVDALLSFIPAIGDAWSFVVSTGYLLVEAFKAGLGSKDISRIIGLQAADFFLGVVPLLGDVGDYFFKANRMSVECFVKNSEALLRKAREAGVPESEILKIHSSAEKWPGVFQRLLKLHKMRKSFLF